jgi:transketolase
MGKSARTEGAEDSAAIQRCRRIRRRIVELSHVSRSAHLGSSLSCVEIIDAVLAASNVRANTVRQPDRDRIVFSKGHAAMAYYSALETWGLLDSQLLTGYLQDGTSLWGHVTCTDLVPAIDVSTGSLGHGLGLAVGFALGHRLRGYRSRIFCILSEGDCDEGTTWEAALFAGHHQLDSMVAIIDYNKIQSIGTTRDVLDLEPLARKWEAFRWSVARIDGHERVALSEALLPGTSGQPRIIIADTVKGKGIPRIENTVASHYHPAMAEDLRFE